MPRSGPQPGFEAAPHRVAAFTLARLDARQPLKLQPLCVSDLLRRTIAERHARQPVVLIAHPHPGTGTDSDEAVLGSRTALTRLFTNLLDNALRHAHSAVTVEVVRTGHALAVEVRDYRPGIPEPDLTLPLQPAGSA